jgi:hypothetical protein
MLINFSRIIAKNPFKMFNLNINYLFKFRKIKNLIELNFKINTVILHNINN